jgi:hypothetical protein
MELKTYEDGALIKIGLGTWKREATRHFGLSTEQIEDSMYLYYGIKRELKKTLDELKAEGMTISELRYHPGLVRDVLTFTPVDGDGATYKRNLEEMMKMFRANFTEEDRKSVV